MGLPFSKAHPTKSRPGLAILFPITNQIKGYPFEVFIPALGQTRHGRYLSIFFIKKLGNKALVVTTRDMNKSERKRYEKK
jgi:uncharacterized DUF497 family protein